MDQPLKCVFLGYLWKVARALHRSKHCALLHSGIEPQRSRSQQAIEFLEKAELPWFDAGKIRENSVLTDIASQGIDLIVVGAFGQILNKKIIESSRYGVINIHTSLLPGYRGGSPIEHQIINGETQAGVTVHWLEEEVDAGDIIDCEAFQLDPDRDDYDVVFERCHDAAARLIDNLLRVPIPQWPHRKQDLSYPVDKPRTKADARVEWEQPATLIRRIVAADGWKGWATVSTSWGDIVLKKVEIVASNGNYSVPGEVVEGGPYPIISTGEGCIRLLEYEGPRCFEKGYTVLIA